MHTGYTFFQTSMLKKSSYIQYNKKNTIIPKIVYVIKLQHKLIKGSVIQILRISYRQSHKIIINT